MLSANQLRIELVLAALDFSPTDPFLAGSVLDLPENTRNIPGVGTDRGLECCRASAPFAGEPDDSG